MFNRWCIVFFWRNISYIWYINIWYSNICIRYIYIYILRSYIWYIIHLIHPIEITYYTILGPSYLETKTPFGSAVLLFRTHPWTSPGIGSQWYAGDLQPFSRGGNVQMTKNKDLTPPKFNSLPLKNDGWKMSFLLRLPIFRAMLNFRGVVGWLVEQNFLEHF